MIILDSLTFRLVPSSRLQEGEMYKNFLNRSISLVLTPKKTKKKVYISGPMTNYQDFNKSAFETAEKALINAGYEPVNPHKLNTNHENYKLSLAIDFQHLIQCDFIYMLDGWERSTGASWENHTASVFGIGVLPESALMTPDKQLS